MKDWALGTYRNEENQVIEAWIEYIDGFGLGRYINTLNDKLQPLPNWQLQSLQSIVDQLNKFKIEP